MNLEMNLKSVNSSDEGDFRTLNLPTCKEKQVKTNLSQGHEAVSERPRSKDALLLARAWKMQTVGLSSHSRSCSEKGMDSCFAHLGKAVVRRLPQFQEIFTLKSPDGVQIQ